MSIRYIYRKIVPILQQDGLYMISLLLQFYIVPTNMVIHPLSKHSITASSRGRWQFSDSRESPDPADIWWNCLAITLRPTWTTHIIYGSEHNPCTQTHRHCISLPQIGNMKSECNGHNGFVALVVFRYHLSCDLDMTVGWPALSHAVSIEHSVDINWLGLTKQDKKGETNTNVCTLIHTWKT